ncbi:hypothetical protein BVG19_g833 [[Candida] boidinii]|nr:hypothetical protein BVG19_g833 [[Candida] boidinii]OWB53607.1 hypothetical protein B5S27_g5211 [[Candida] boidinii]
MAPAIKGLMQFITDIRNAKAQEEEEKRVQSELIHIQKQFQQPHLSGYHRKKYICKLIYIYLLGYKIDIGFNESIDLMNSKLYSEKSIGYLALNLFISIDPTLIDAILERVKRDLNSNDENFNCLALHFISSSIDDPSNAQFFENDVFLLLRSPTISNLIKKKACLAFLKLIKADSSILLRHPDWIQKILSLLDSDDLGLAISLTSLIEYIAKLDYNSCKPIIPVVANHLKKLIINDMCPTGYYYYGFSCPWLVIRLFSLLEILIPDIDEIDIDTLTLNLIESIIHKTISISISKRNSKSLETRNTASFLLFGAISLAAHINPSQDESNAAADALCSLLNSSETNTRYLALDSLAKISIRGDTKILETVRNHMTDIFNLLKDKDISIKRKALDLIYITCDSTTVEKTCQELLQYLTISDYSMKLEIAVKIAVVSENYATDATWYVITILKLISVAGSHVNDEVWQRLIQIIVNNDSIHLISLKSVLKYLKSGNYPESMLKIASFLLGEYNLKIKEIISPLNQFELLFNKYYQCSVSTKVMLLSCFLKYYSNYEELRPRIHKIFESELHSFSSELQQRSIEYINLIRLDKTRNNNELFKLLIVSMPPFTLKSSPLITRLGNVKVIESSFKVPSSSLLTSGNDKTSNGSYSPASPGYNASSKSQSPSPIPIATSSSKNISIPKKSSIPPMPPTSRNSNLNVNTNTNNSNNSALNLGAFTNSGSALSMIPAFTGSTVSSSSPRSRSSTMNNNMMRGVQQQQLTGNNINYNNNNDNNFNGLDDPLSIRQRGVSTSSLLSTIQDPSTQSNDILSPNWENGYYRLVHFDQGIFYENSLIKILFRLKREKTTLSFQLTYSNKSPNTINSLLTEIKPLHYNDNNPPYVIQLLQHPEHLIKIDGKTTQVFSIAIRSEFYDYQSPIINISYVSGGVLTNLKLRLPCILLKTLNSVPLESGLFFQRWNQIGTTLGVAGECQKVINFKTNKHLLNNDSSISIFKRIFEKFGFAIVENADPNPNNFVAAGILNTILGNSGSLMRIELRPDFKSMRITVRSTKAINSKILGNTISDFFENGF